MFTISTTKITANVTTFIAADPQALSTTHETANYSTFK
jgi:hypothetical protein